MPKGVYKRKKKSRNKNKITDAMEKVIADLESSNPPYERIRLPKDYQITTTPTRLDVLMSEFETELQRVISKMKAMF